MIAHGLIRAGPNCLDLAGLLQDKFAPRSSRRWAVSAGMSTAIKEALLQLMC